MIGRELAAALPGWRRLVVPALLMILPVAFFPSVCLAGQTLLLRDLHDWFYPWRRFARQWLAQGDIPLWNPWSYTGTPFLANMQSGMLYPLNAPFWLLDFPAAMRFFLVAQFGATAVATYWLFRVLRCRVVSSLTAAIGYAFGGWMMVHLEFPNKLSAAGWLPLIVIGLIAWWRGRIFGGLALGASGVALSLLAGYPQTTETVVLGAAVLWICWVARCAVQRDGRAFARAALSLPCMALLGAIVAGAQLIPFAEAAALSERAAPKPTGSVLIRSLEPGHFLALLSPHLFGAPGYGRYWGGELLQFWLGHFYTGLFVLAPACLSPLLLRKGAGAAPAPSPRPRAPVPSPEPGMAADVLPSRRWMVMAGLVLAVVAGLASMGAATPFGPLLVALIPGLGHFRWFSTTSVLIAFALCWLAAPALDAVAEAWERDRRAIRRAGLAALAVALAPATVVGLAAASPSAFQSLVRAVVSTVMRTTQSPALEAHFDLVRGDAVRAAALLAALAAAWIAASRGRLSPARALWAVPILLVLDLLGANAGVLFTGDPAIHRDPPATLERLRSALPDSARFFVTGDTLSNDALIYGADQDSYFRWASETFLFNLNLPWDLFSASGGDTVRSRRAAAWQEQVEGTKDNERRRRLLAAAGVAVVLRGSPGEPSLMISVPGVLPRARVVSGLRRVTEAAALESIAAGTWEPSREALVEEDYGGTLAPPGNPVAHTIHALRHTPDTATVDVTSASDGWLVLDDLMYPGWTAQVDGRPAAPFTADYVGRGVAIPSGRHTVVFTYRPASVPIGVAASAAGMLALAGLAWADRRRSAR